MRDRLRYRFANFMSKNFGVSLTPDKNERIRISRADTLVVLAEDET